jgi:hypothetical protein
VDAGNAGFGNLEIAIKDHDGVIIPSHVTQMDNTSAKFLVTFTPTKSGMHTVNITFNKEILKSECGSFELNLGDLKHIVGVGCFSFLLLVHRLGSQKRMHYIFAPYQQL